MLFLYLVVRRSQKVFFANMRPTQATGNKQLTRLHFLVPQYQSSPICKDGESNRANRCVCVCECVYVGGSSLLKNESESRNDQQIFCIQYGAQYV